MNYHAFTALILVTALGAYATGFAAASGPLLLGAGALELWFWVRAWRGRPDA